MTQLVEHPPAGCCVPCLTFKKNPLDKLQKEHADLLARAHKMSTVDRTKSDAVAEAAKVEARIVELQNQAS